MVSKLGGMACYGALVAYCVKYFWNVDIGATLDGFMNVLLPVLMAFGIVNNPTSKGTV